MEKRDSELDDVEWLLLYLMDIAEKEKAALWRALFSELLDAHKKEKK